jgi:hypothetical protein
VQLLGQIVFRQEITHGSPSGSFNPVNQLSQSRPRIAGDADPDALEESFVAILREPAAGLGYARRHQDVFRGIASINSRTTSDSKAKGVLLILDELGKFLEFASLYPERQDVFLLQRLAEAASRSGDKPLYVVCLLHQGFNAYASHLNQAAQCEWEKVAGRFEEILFNQPIEQIAHLMASALNVTTSEIPRPDHQDITEAINSTVRLGWYGAAEPKRLSDAALRLYPLHPTALPILIRAFRRFGQNERSLFSFLLSDEPFGLQVFSCGTLGQG